MNYVIRTIDECFFQIQNGANIKQGDIDGGFPVTRIETTANDKFNRDRMGYAGITDISKYESYVLEDGDLLMSHINSVQYLGRTVLYVKQPDETIIHGMNLLRLKAKRDIINPAYARYCFYGHPFRNQISNITKKSVNQASFAVKDLKQIKIDVPSVAEQTDIVEILDKIQRLIELRMSELLKLDELIKARFVEMFGHQSHNEKGLPYLTIDDVAEIYLGITHTPTYVENGVMFISAKNTSGDFLDLSDVKYISREEFESAPKGSKPQINDVLFSRVGSNLGHPVILEEEMELCTFVSLGFLRTKGSVTSNYLKHWMRDDFFAKQVSEHVKGGGQPNLNTGWLKEFKIIVPDIVYQREFDEFCKQVDKSKVVVQKSLYELQVLFDSLMQQYFG